MVYALRRKLVVLLFLHVWFEPFCELLSSNSTYEARIILAKPIIPIMDFGHMIQKHEIICPLSLVLCLVSALFS